MRILQLAILFFAFVVMARAQVCSVDQGLQCAGHFSGNVNGPYTTGVVCASSTFSGTIPYQADFAGGYQDFYTAPNGGIVWGSYSASNSPQSLASAGTCFLPCTSGIPVNLLGCPSPSASTAPATAGFSAPVYGLTGSLLGETPYIQSGVPVCVPYSFFGVPVTVCSAGYGPLTLGAEMTGPNHCTDVIITLTPPQCVCGGAATCDTSSNTYTCAPSATTQVVFVDEPCEDEGAFCTCHWQFIYTYQCGTLVGITADLVYIDDCVA